MKLILHNVDELKENKTTFIKQNAFIKPDGTFYIAKGYTGCNPWHQLESSALWVGRQDIGYDFIEKYHQFLKKLEESDPVKYQEYLKRIRAFSPIIGATKLEDKRSVLIHYYGYVLFCRTELIRAFNDRDIFFDRSVIPEPSIHGREITLEQQTTLEELFNINDGEKVSSYAAGKYITNKDEMLKYVLTKKNHDRRWHC